MVFDLCFGSLIWQQKIYNKNFKKKLKSNNKI